MGIILNSNVTSKNFLIVKGLNDEIEVPQLEAGNEECQKRKR